MMITFVEMAAKKILIIRFSSIGDVVLTTPVIRCVKEQLPDVELHYLTKKSFIPLLKANPYIDKLFYVERDIGEVMPELKAMDYDHIIDLHKNIRSLGVRMKLRKPSTTFPKLNIDKWLLVHTKINRLPNVHIVDRYFKAVEKLGVSNDQKGLDFYIPEEDLIDPNSLETGGQEKFVVFVIGGKHGTKCLPKEKIISICQKINKPVILLGGAEDVDKGDYISSNAGIHVVSMCGQLNINQSAAIIKLSDHVVTHDTGLMHIAAAFNKPITSIWGNTVPEFGMYPYMPQLDTKGNIVEVKPLSCRPCSKIGYDTCPKKHFRCMMDIDEEKVVREV
jgi:ADP-heptose:LPS heptosyltransferase